MITRSAAAVFLLSQRGLDIYVLEGGLNSGVPADIFGLTADLPEEHQARETLSRNIDQLWSLVSSASNKK